MAEIGDKIKCGQCGAVTHAMAAMCPQCGAPLELAEVKGAEAGAHARAPETLVIPLEAVSQPEEDTAVLPRLPEPLPIAPAAQAAPVPAPAAASERIPPPVPAPAVRRGADPSIVAGAVLALLFASVVLVAYVLLRPPAPASDQVAGPVPAEAPAPANAGTPAPSLSATASQERQAYVDGIQPVWKEALVTQQAFAEAVDRGDLARIAQMAKAAESKLDVLLARAKRATPPAVLINAHHDLLTGLESWAEVFQKVRAGVGQSAQPEGSTDQIGLILDTASRARRAFEMVHTDLPELEPAYQDRLVDAVTKFSQILATAQIAGSVPLPPGYGLPGSVPAAPGPQRGQRGRREGPPIFVAPPVPPAQPTPAPPQEQPPASEAPPSEGTGKQPETAGQKATEPSEDTRPSTGEKQPP